MDINLESLLQTPWKLIIIFEKAIPNVHITGEWKQHNAL